MKFRNKFPSRYHLKHYEVFEFVKLSELFGIWYFMLQGLEGVRILPLHLCISSTFWTLRDSKLTTPSTP